MVADVKFARVTALPLNPQPNTIYFVKPNNSSTVKIWVTGIDSIPHPVVSGP